MTQKLWGIDLGGTKIEGVVLAGENVLCRKRIETQRELGYEHILDRIQELIQQISSEISEKPSCVGFGTPGVLDPKLQLMKNCNTTCLNGKPLKRDLEQKLKVKVCTANDANCFALAENRMGAGRGAKTMFGVILGTGVGGGVIINGEALYGKQGIAGEWGHNQLLADGPPCYCGKNGCVETILSGPALEDYYESLSGRRLSLAQIYANHKDSYDPFAEQLIERLVKNLARALAAVINILDPEAIVLGGGVSNLDLIYEELPKELASTKWVFNNRVETAILRAKLGDSAGVFGAAWLCGG